MSLLDSLRHSLLEEDVETVLAPGKAVEAAAVSVAPAPIPVLQHQVEFAPVPALTPAPAPDGLLSRLRDKLHADDAASRLEATLASLTAIPDAGTRVAAAVSVLKASAGITAPQIQQAYDMRLNELGKQAGLFQQWHTATTAQEVTSRESEIDKIASSRESEIDKIASDITQHSTAIQQLDTRARTLNEELIFAKAKLASDQAGFTDAVAVLRKELGEALDRLKGAAQC